MEVEVQVEKESSKNVRTSSRKTEKNDKIVESSSSNSMSTPVLSRTISSTSTNSSIISTCSTRVSRTTSKKDDSVSNSIKYVF